MDVQRRGRQILLHGLAMVMFGLVVGVAVPEVPHPRLGLVAHIQMTSNGVLFIVIALLLLTLPNNIGPRSALAILGSACLTWLMGFSQVANAWWGTKDILPIAAQQAGATGGAAWQEGLVTAAHVASGLGLLVAWVLLIAGFVRAPAAD